MFLKMTRTLIALGTLALFGSLSFAEEIVLLPSGDVSIYEGEANTANSTGQNLFSGATSAFKNNNLTRRALLAFDLASSLPANATITDASLSLTVNLVPGNRQQNGDFGLFAVTTPWIEGATEALGAGGQGAAKVGEDTTWTSTGIGDWSTAGGDYVSEPSAVTSVGAAGSYIWNSSTMVTDLQSWLTEPDTNHGWILVVDGDPPPTLTAKRIASRENQDEASRPTLSISYELSGPLLGDYDGDQELTADDIGFVCTAINGGQNPAEFDLNGDSLVNLADLGFWLEDLKGTFLGDTNLNGSVEFTDFLQLSTQFGFETPQPEPNFSGWGNADFNCDYKTDFDDFLIMATHFGRTREMSATVPEPSSSIVWLLGVLCWSFRQTSVTWSRCRRQM